MIELRNVNYNYNKGIGKGSLKNINLSIKQGELVLICGESGCGKTTLIRLMNGLIPNYYGGNLEGSVLVNNLEINKRPLQETAKMVGSVFQNPRSQFFNVDTTSEISFGCENQGLSREVILDRVKNTVSNFKIQSLMERSIFELSGGEKQKIACASVSATGPEIFILDEPSSNLDTEAIEDLRELISFWKKKGKTIVIAEHRLYYLKELIDRVIYMKEGMIEKEFSPNQLKLMNAKKLEELGLRPLSLNQLQLNKNLNKKDNDKLVLSDFSFGYKRKHPVIDIPNLEIPIGSIVAIIGHNGAGKSTFAKCLCGLKKKSKGVMRINKEEYKASKRLKKCYMVMQDVNHQLFTESVIDEVLLSMEKPNIKEAEEVLESCDLLKMKDRHPMSLSGGQKQRVAIASAVVSNRKVILFDEPTSGLDLRHMKQVSKNIKKLQSLDKTQFIITHDLEFILNCCTYIVHLEKGKVVDNYPMDEVGIDKVLSFFLRYQEELENVR